MTEAGPKSLVGCCDIDWNVSCGVCAHRRTSGMMIPRRTRYFPVDRPANRLEVEERQHRLEQGHAYPLTLSTLLSLQQCHKYPNREQMASSDIRDCDTGTNGAVLRCSRDTHEA